MGLIIEKLNERFLRDDLKSFCISFFHEENKIFLQYKTHKVEVSLLNDSLVSEANESAIEEEWKEAFSNSNSNSNSNYSSNNDILFFEKGFEIPLKLIKRKMRGPSGIKNLHYEFADNKNRISIDYISKDFLVNFFNSDAYAIYWKNFFKENKFKSFVENDEIGDRNVSIYWFIRGILYSAKFENRDENFNQQNLNLSINLIKSSIYSLLVNRKDIFNLKVTSFEDKVSGSSNENDSFINESVGNDFEIPKIIYDENLVSYYKAAYNSSLPSQKYLDFYHVFEYLFLSISESYIYDKVKTYINHPKFRSDDKDIEKVISLIKRNNTENDETEMLKKVLSKFIDEDDLIEFICINQLDKVIKDKYFFGEKFTLSPKSGHLISNLSKLLKHVRNALVHSSDRYKREDCHIPFSESENLIRILIPTMDFLAQKIIAGTAKNITDL